MNRRNQQRWPLTAASAALLLVAGCGGGDGGAGEACVPDCREGYVCVEGACVEACNPPCPEGERCTAERTCEPAPGADGGRDAGDDDSGTDGGSSIDDGGAGTDGGRDAGDDDSGTDGGSSIDDGGMTSDGGGLTSDSGTGTDSGMTSDGGTGTDGGGLPTSCPAGQVACAGGCREPVLPPTGSARVLWSARGVPSEILQRWSVALDPCSGTFALATIEDAGGPTDNLEVYLRLYPPGTDPASVSAVRVTFAPGHAEHVRVLFARDRFVILWTDPRHDTRPDTCADSCHREVHFAAYAPDGTELVGDTRLSTVEGAVHRIRALGASYLPSADRLLVAWRRRGDGDVAYTLRGLRATLDGTVLDASPVLLASAVDERFPDAPQPQADGTRWTLFFGLNHPGSRPDRMALRTVASDGTLGDLVEIRSVSLGNPSYAVARHGDGTWSTLTREGGPPGHYLRRWPADWSSSRRVQVPAITAARGTLAWDGRNYYVFARLSRQSYLVRLNGDGTETARVPLDVVDLDSHSIQPAWVRVVGGELLVAWMELRYISYQNVISTRVQHFAPGDF